MSKENIVFAEIEFPGKYLTPEIEKLIRDDGDHICLYENGELVSFSGFVQDGEFEIEALMRKTNIPFDRHSEGYGVNANEKIYFRPKSGTLDQIDISILLDRESNPYIKTEVIRPFLNLPPEEALQEVKKLLEIYDPSVPPLSEYI